jgi:Transcriptional regulators
MNCRIAEQFFEIMNLLKDDQKQVRDYGMGIKINHIEASFLDVIHRLPDANVSQVARKLGITKGAVTQAYAKLTEKGLIESFMRAGNKKEKYFRLTAVGDVVRQGHEQFHEEANESLCRYFSSLSDEEARTIFDFFDQLKECVPFCEFTCRHGNADHTAKEAEDERNTARDNQSSCSSGNR